MPEETPTQPNNSRSLGIALGVTEVIFLLGLALLAFGSFVLFSWAGASILIGVCLLVTVWTGKL